MAEEELQEALFPDLESPDQEIEQLKLELEEKTRAHQELEHQYKRLAADFENYRRRQAAEREDLTKYAGSKLLEGFLPLIDNFERAIQAGRKAQDVATLQQGIELIYRQMADFLSRSGVKPLACVGQPFDPNLHEAIGQVMTCDHPDQTVMYEVERGYLYHDRVLRYAKVQVAVNEGQTTKPSEDESSSAEKEEING